MRRVIVPAELAPTRPAPGGVVHRLDGRTMGTTWSVAWVAPLASSSSSPPNPIEALRSGIQHELDVVVDEMSTWDAGSSLRRFNRAPPATWHRLAPGFFGVLQHALRVAEQSGGAFDPCIGALVDLWGFGSSRPHTEAGFVCPSAVALKAALARSGWRRLEVDARAGAVRQPGGLRLDLSAIAKGFGVDQVVRFLHRAGIESCLVEVGGELRGEGAKPDGQPWWVGLESPPAIQASVRGEAVSAAASSAAGIDAVAETVVALHGLSAATSGDYRRCFDVGGRRYSHTIDPRDGEPIGHGLASVTVLHRDCIAADALSTALNVMGTGPGLVFAQRHAIAARFVSRLEGGGYEEFCSDALRAMLE